MMIMIMLIIWERESLVQGNSSPAKLITSLPHNLLSQALARSQILLFYRYQTFISYWLVCNLGGVSIEERLRQTS